MNYSKFWLLIILSILSGCDSRSRGITPANTSSSLDPVTGSGQTIFSNAPDTSAPNTTTSPVVITPPAPVTVSSDPIITTDPVTVPQPTSKPLTELTGVFLDSPIINATYATETLSGVTDSQGEYSYLPGETVVFSIGDLMLPSVTAAEIITPLSLVGTSDSTNAQVVNIVRLLQTLDQDANPDNGITISETAKATATQVDFEQTEEDFAASGAVTNLIYNAGQNIIVAGLVSKSDALTHFERELTTRGLEFTSRTKQAAELEFNTVAGPLNIINENNYILENVRISNPNGDCIRVSGSQNIIIKNSWIGPCKGEGISIDSSANIEITQNYFEAVRTGVYARTLSKAINVHHNEFKDILGPYPRGQIVQLNDVDGGGSRINYNYVINSPNIGDPEDTINLYNSDGLPGDKIEIIGNYINGGGPSTIGGGIMTGDKDGSYILVADNVLVNPGQYGIAVASGHHIDIVDNKVYSGQQSYSNVGAYIWNQYDAPCYNNTFVRNHVYWISKSGRANHWWEAVSGKRAGGRCKNTTMLSNTWGSKEVSESMPPPSGAGITEWNGPLTSN